MYNNVNIRNYWRSVYIHNNPSWPTEDLTHSEYRQAESGIQVLPTAICNCIGGVTPGWIVLGAFNSTIFFNLVLQFSESECCLAEQDNQIMMEVPLQQSWIQWIMKMQFISHLYYVIVSWRNSRTVWINNVAARQRFYGQYSTKPLVTFNSNLLEMSSSVTSTIGSG